MKDSHPYRKYLFGIIALVGAGLILYLSWRPTPQMTTVWFIPHPIAVWADQNRNDTFRTAIPFAVLGSLTGIYLTWQKQLPKQWLGSLLALIGLVVLAEAGQLLLVHRSCDPGDVGWGIIGGATGLGIIYILKILLFRKQKQFS